MDLEEDNLIAAKLVMRLTDGSMPPDDAYWWTRYVCEAMKRHYRPHRFDQFQDALCEALQEGEHA